MICNYCGQQQPAEKPCSQCGRPESTIEATVRVWQDLPGPAELKLEEERKSCLARFEQDKSHPIPCKVGRTEHDFGWGKTCRQCGVTMMEWDASRGVAMETRREARAKEFAHEANATDPVDFWPGDPWLKPTDPAEQAKAEAALTAMAQGARKWLEKQLAEILKSGASDPATIVPGLDHLHDNVLPERCKGLPSVALKSMQTAVETRKRAFMDGGPRELTWNDYRSPVSPEKAMADYAEALRELSAEDAAPRPEPKLVETVRHIKFNRIGPRSGSNMIHLMWANSETYAWYEEQETKLPPLIRQSIAQAPLDAPLAHIADSVMTAIRTAYPEERFLVEVEPE